MEAELSTEENNLEIIENIKYNTTFSHKIEIFGFGNLEQSALINIYKDGRPFSHFIEPWLAINYPLKHVTGCKYYDHTDINDENVKYDQKTFTKSGGCKFMTSNMIGEGRTFNKEIFEEKAKKLISLIEYPPISSAWLGSIENYTYCKTWVEQ